jgi:hypothetical protein
MSSSVPHVEGCGSSSLMDLVFLVSSMRVSRAVYCKDWPSLGSSAFAKRSRLKMLRTCTWTHQYGCLLSVERNVACKYEKSIQTHHHERLSHVRNAVSCARLLSSCHHFLFVVRVVAPLRGYFFIYIDVHGWIFCNLLADFFVWQTFTMFSYRHSLTKRYFLEVLVRGQITKRQAL